MKECVIVLLLWVMVSCLAIENKSQSKPPGNTQVQTTSIPKVDVSGWQTVRLAEHGIELQVPPDWRRNETHFEQPTFIIDEWDWAGPNKEMVMISLTTYRNGFISSKRTVASKEELVTEQFNRMTRIQDSSLNQVRRYKISGIEGVFIMRSVVLEGGMRVGPLWTGYRIYSGKAQKIEAEVASNPQGETLLQTIFNTIEIEQDRDVNPNP